MNGEFNRSAPHVPATRKSRRLELRRAIQYRREVNLPVHPGKVLRLFAPIWLLLALSLWINWVDWQSKPVLLAAIALLPLLAASATHLLRDSWRLELTAESLIHHTLSRSERFDWARMGPIVLGRARISDLLFVRTFWFAFPLDAPHSLSERGSRLFGRRLLCVFGDLSPVDIVTQIEEWRALYERRS